MKFRTLLFIVISAVSFCGCDRDDRAGGGNSTPVLRVGFFPNITHAPALVGYHETQTKAAEGWFEKRTGAKIEWYPFNAGPSAIEALLTGSIDVTYVGPNPVLNGYTRTKGTDVRVLSGAARGGAALVVQANSTFRVAADFRGRKIATPQLGGTQDVAARAWLAAGGLKITQRGGDASVIPTPNPDQLDLFARQELDAVWTVEPWVSRLELEAGAKILLEQKDVLTTLLAASTRALAQKRELLEKFVAAHEELTAKVAAEPEWAKPAVSAALHKATGKAIPARLLDHAWPRLTFTTDINPGDFAGIQRDARSAGLLPGEADLTKLFQP
jgi:NitT/TauT family transport system substrate-binding protein